MQLSQTADFKVWGTERPVREEEEEEEEGNYWLRAGHHFRSYRHLLSSPIWASLFLPHTIRQPFNFTPFGGSNIGFRQLWSKAIYDGSRVSKVQCLNKASPGIYAYMGTYLYLQMSRLPVGFCFTYANASTSDISPQVGLPFGRGLRSGRPAAGRKWPAECGCCRQPACFRSPQVTLLRAARAWFPSASLHMLNPFPNRLAIKRVRDGRESAATYDYSSYHWAI